MDVQKTASHELARGMAGAGRRGCLSIICFTSKLKAHKQEVCSSDKHPLNSFFMEVHISS